MDELSGWCNETCLITGVMVQEAGVYIMLVPEVAMPGVRTQMAPDGEIMTEHVMVRAMYEPGAVLLCLN